MKLVDNWKQCWKWYSMHPQWVQTAAVGTWVNMPGDWRAAFPAKYLVVLCASMMVIGMLGRLIDQNKKVP